MTDRPRHLQVVPDDAKYYPEEQRRQTRTAEQPNYLKRQALAALAIAGSTLLIAGGVKVGHNIASGDKDSGPAPVERVVDALEEVPAEQVVPVSINAGDGLDEIIEKAMPQAHTNETLMDAEREIVSEKLGMASPGSIVPGDVTSVNVPTVEQDPDTNKIVPPIEP